MMKQKAPFKIDLTKVKGDGEFPCPSCGVTISPDDESGRTYDVIDVKTERDGSLEEVVILCKKCRSITYLKGFEALNEMEKSVENS